MKHYYFNGKESEGRFGDVMRDTDNKIEVKILIGQNVDMDLANKIAALGQPVFAQDLFVESITNMLQNSVECMVLELDVNLKTLSHVIDAITELETNPALFGTFLCLTELNCGDEDYEPIADQTWNEIIVRCADHGIPMCWSGDAAGYRFSKYLKEING